jgi:hypothetical protein
MRLEQLNKSDTDKEYKSQKKYIQELENLNIECASSWNNDDRVKALKIVIKVLFLFHSFLVYQITWKQ